MDYLKYLSMSITNYLYITISLSPIIMKKLLILLLTAMILLSGCVEKTVKSGDKISVDYVGSLENGKVFDTSIESVAKENNILITGREYKPLNFTVGKGGVIKGFDEDVVGMKVGETKTLTIPPEKGYGPINPELLQAIPVIEIAPATRTLPATRTIPKVLDIPRGQFEQVFGQGHNNSEIVRIPETNINLTIKNITSIVSLAYNLEVGDLIWSSRAPWNETVEKIDDGNITLKANVSKNDTVQVQGAPWNETVEKIDNGNITLIANLSKNDIIHLQGVPWNTTVVDLNNTNITLRHNPIPDTFIPTMFGKIKISFNETSIILDRNHELAGKTLIFNVTLRSINK